MFEFQFTALDFLIRIECSHKSHLESVRGLLETVFSDHFKIEQNGTANVSFAVREGEDGELTFLKNGEFIVKGKPENRFYEFVESRVRLEVAENAPNHVFVHAGVVRLGTEAIVFPAKSYSGKSKLVLEMVKRGAEYVSDEYCVIDANGKILPFTKPISVREPGKFDQSELDVSEIDGVKADSTSVARAVLFTSFESGSIWDPREISRGEGVIRTIEHTACAKKYPEKALKFLGKFASDAKFYSTKRPEAEDVAGLVKSLI